MRLVFVNHCHPDTPHVCAARARGLAQACADMGAQAVLLTESLNQESTNLTPAEVCDSLARHDWRRVFHLSAAPKGGVLAKTLREGSLPRPLRRPVLAAYYWIFGGLFTDWRNGAQTYLPILAQAFAPDAVWGTFGNTDAWVIARRLARSAGAKWIADVKDPWTAFIPGPLQKTLAQRFADMDVLTALSDQHGAEAAPWFGKPALTVYSGIDQGFLTIPPAPPGRNRILVIGALYNQLHLNELLSGFKKFYLDVQICYAGSETARMRQACNAAGLSVETVGYVDLPTLRALAADSDALAYVRAPRALHQHKVIEMLALDRPIFCVPDEASETQDLCRILGGSLHACPNSDALAEAMSEIMGRHPAVDRVALSRFTWQSQAEILLEAVR